MRRIKVFISNLSLPLKCSIVYMLSSVLVNGLSLLTTPIFTRILSTEEMGVVTTFSSWQTILSAIVTLSLGSASYSVAMVDFKEERDKYDSSILFLSSLSSILFFAIFICAHNFWSSLLGLDKKLIIIMLISFFIMPSITFWMARQRYEFRYKPLLIVSVLSAILSTASALLFVLFEKKYGHIDLGTSRIIGKFFPEFLLGIGLFFYIFRKGKVFFSRKYWSFALKLSLPLIVHSLSKHILDTSDRIMIDRFCGKSEVGIYGVLYTVSTLSIIVWSAINASLIPVMFERIKDGRANEINRIAKPLILIYGVFAVLLTLLSPEIVHILAPKEYYSAIYIMPPIACGIFLTSFYTIFGNYLTYYKKTSIIMISTLCAAFVNVILNYFFIPKYGSIAAAYTTLIAYVVLSIFQFVSTRIVCGKNAIDFRFMVLCSIVTIGWCLICNILYKNTIIRFVILGIIILLFAIFWKKIYHFIRMLIASRYNPENQ